MLRAGQVYYDSDTRVFYTLLSPMDAARDPARFFWRVLMTHPATGRSGVLENFRFPARSVIDDYYERVI